MTDQSASDPNAGSAQKSPLDVLEEILKDAQQKKTAGGGGADPVADPGTDGTAPVAPDGTAAPTEAEQMAVIHAQQAAQQAQDQVQLQQKVAELAQIKNMPEYQARVDQQTKEVQQKADQSAATEGFEIRQLDHTKLPSPPTATS